jgi:hypothetical protein
MQMKLHKLAPHSVTLHAQVYHLAYPADRGFDAGM